MKYFYVLVVLIIVGVFCVIEVPRLQQQKMRGELFAFAGFLLIGLVLAVSMLLQFRVPNPTEIIEFVYNPLTNWFYPK